MFIGDWLWGKLGLIKIEGAILSKSLIQLMLLNCGCWRRLLRVPWTTRRSNQSILKKISPEYSLEELMGGGFLVGSCLTLSSETCISLYTFIQTKKELQNDYERIIWKWLDLGFMTEMGMISVQFSHSVMSNSLRPHRLQHAKLPVHHQLPELTQTPVHGVGDAIQPSHPLLSPSPPAFNLSQRQGLEKSQFFTPGGERIKVSASASVLPMNIQDWSSWGWTGWISLQSKGFLRVFSNTTAQKHQFFTAQRSL